MNLSVIQSMLRHARPSTSALYTHGVNAAQLAAQEMFLNAIGIQTEVFNNELSTSG